MQSCVRISRLLLILAIGAILLTRILALADNRDPERDMAMLMTNVPLASWSAYFKPLPYYEQTTTLAHLAVIDAVSEWFGTEGKARMQAVRALAALAGLIGLGAIWAVFRRRIEGWELAILLLLGATSLQMMVFSVSEKQYVWGLMASALVLLAACRHAAAPGRGTAAALVGAGALAALLDFAAPVIACMAGGGLLFHAAVTRAGWPAIVRIGVVGALALLPSVIAYLAYTREVTRYDLIAYAVSDGPAYLKPLEGLTAHNLLRLELMVKIWSALYDPPYLVETLLKVSPLRALWALGTVVLSVWGFVRLVRIAPVIAGALLSGLAVIVVLNVLRLMHITSTQHFLFLAPVLVPAFALGATALLATIARLLPENWRLAPAAAVVGVLCVLGLVRSANLDLHRVEAHLARVIADPAPLWVYYNGQPTITALNPPLQEVLGLLPYESDETAWSLGARDDDLTNIREAYFTGLGDTLAGRERAYLLFDNYTLSQKHGGIDRYRGIAEAAVGPCERYDDVGTVLLDCRAARTASSR